MEKKKRKKLTEMTQHEKTEYMTTEKMSKLILQVALPTIVTMLLSSIYNLTDTYFVGKINNEASAAVGIALSIMNLIQAFGYFFGQGGGTYISREMGKKHVDNSNQMITMSALYAFLTGLFLMVMGLLFINELCKQMGAIQSVLPYTISYVRIILLGAPIVILSCVLNNQLRFQGSANYAMMGIVVGVITNAILDPLLIFKFHLDIQGAAIATVVSQLLSCLILWSGTKKKGNMNISFQHISWNLLYPKEIGKGGFPTLARQGLATVAILLCNRVTGEYGAIAIAGMGIMQRIMVLANASLVGFGQGFQSVCGINYGAKKYERIKQGFWFGIIITTVYLTIQSWVLYIYADQFVMLFRKDKQVIEVAAAALRYLSLALPVNGYIILGNMLLQVCGKSVRATLLSMSRQGFFYLPLILYLPQKIGLLGIEITQMISDYLTFLISLPIICIFLFQIKKMENH